MNLFKAIIVEDEIQNAELLQHFIKKHCPRINLEGTAYTIHEAEIIIKEKKPHILFLDILINGELIFEVLKKVDLPEKSQIIFITAFDEFAIKAIKANALDYLLKPINIKELKLAVDKAISNLNVKIPQNNHFFNELESSIKGLLQNQQKRIAISSQNETIFINENDILFLTSQRKYTIINLKNGSEHVSTKNIGEYEKMLTPKIFFRIHHSHIINLNYLTKIDKTKGSYCELIDGTLLPLSIRKGKELRNYIKF